MGLELISMQVYVKNTELGYIIVCLYMDDMIIIENSKHMTRSTKDTLSSLFDIKDLV